MRIILILMGLLIAGSPTLVSAQLDPKPELLQQHVQSAIAKAYAASVFIADYDTIAKRTNGQRFSGVVVSKDGIILTAAHVGRTGKVYQIIFPDGKESIAIGMGRIQYLDAAVLKINKPGSWPYAEMGWSSSLKINEPCVSIASPGSFVPPKTVIRFGYVADPLEYNRQMIRTTCLMEPGDSGGPVFDLLGRVIGLHSKITLELENNFEVPIDVFRRYWSALMKAEDYYDLPSEDKIPRDTLIDRMSYGSITGLESMLAETESKFDKAAVQLVSESELASALGTLVKINGSKKSYIISKNSLLPNSLVSIVADGQKQPLKIVHRDDKRDLVLLELSTALNDGIDLSKVSRDSLVFDDLGKIMISPDPTNLGEISVLGTLRFDLPAIYSAGYLGLRLELENNRNLVKMIQEKSPAGGSGLKIGDEVLSINDEKVSSPEQFIKELQKSKPNDRIRLAYKRDGVEGKLDITLAKRPYITMDHAAERFTDGKSDRRDGFRKAFVHDGKLKPAECGGPVFDLKGNFMGINIARYSRTSSIAISTAEILDFIQDALAVSKMTSSQTSPHHTPKS